MEHPVTVAIIEDHPVVTEGVASWIRSDPDQRVRLVHTARDLTALHAAPRPPADVIILDLELSGELVTAQIPGLVAAGYRVVAFSGHSDPVIVIETLDNGAHAYISKEEGRDHLVEAVLAAAADRPYVTRSQARAMLTDQRSARPTLSQQEQQALLLWFQGMSKASVGRRMSISENTVRQYINRARAKVRGHRADRAEQGRAARPRDRGRRDQAGRDHAVQVIRPSRGRPPLPGCPGPVNGPGPPSPPRTAAQPNRPQAEAGLHGRALRRHQIVG
jgi:two-component system, NarL family, nitrate/nitrite response regulator NarL